MNDIFKNVPTEIKDEVKKHGLTLSSLSGGIEKPVRVGIMPIIQKENKDLIKKLKENGWIQRRERIVGGVKYVGFEKVIKYS